MTVQRFRWILRGVVLMAFVVALCGCSGERVETSTTSSPAGGTQAAVDVDDSGVAPDFVLENLEGDAVRLSDYDGNVRLVDFWTTWCAPCREEIPMFKDLQQTYGPDGFTILAIAMDDSGLEVIKPFAEKHQLTYLNLIGTAEVEQLYPGVVGYPTAFLIDRDGTIVERFTGPKPRKVLEKKIVALLGKDATAQM